MQNKITLAAMLTGFWLLLSGYYQPLMLFFMVVSVAVVLFITQRMQADQFEINPLARIGKITLFFFWFVVEIIKSNIVVAKCVWVGKSVRPAMREVRFTQKTRAGRVLYANAITLTPGTLSMDLDEENQTILVHALSPDMLDDLDKGEMDKRICQVEGD